MNSAMAQEKGSGIIQVLVGLAVGTGLALTLFGLAFFYAPRPHESQAIPGAPQALVSSTLTRTATATITPEATASLTPVPSETTLAATPTATATQETVAGDSSMFDPIGSLPPPPLPETITLGNVPQPDQPAPITGSTPTPTGIPMAIPTPESTGGVSEGPSPSPTQPLPALVTPTPTSSFQMAALNARKRAETAQDSADSLDAAQLAETPYVKGLQLYTEGIESLEKDKFRTAERHFVDAAQAFILAASLSTRARIGQPLPGQPLQLVEQARSLVSRREYTQAEKAYLEYLRQNSQDAEIVLEYGEMLTDRVSYTRGMKLLAQTLQMPNLHPLGRARIHARFAEGYRRSGDLNTAIREIRLALRDDPQNSNYASMYNQYHYEASERAKAQQQRQNSQQRVIGDLTGSLIDSLIH